MQIEKISPFKVPTAVCSFDRISNCIWMRNRKLKLNF
uniref:Uncharacterized protein n=1 Tax=Anguilla anguilla TaxID=7936 RepID=A0A0E9SY62_ANGAN